MATRKRNAKWPLKATPSRKKRKSKRAEGDAADGNEWTEASRLTVPDLKDLWRANGGAVKEVRCGGPLHASHGTFRQLLSSLLALFRLTQDDRFELAAKLVCEAVIDHGLVGDDLRYKNWKYPAQLELQRAVDILACRLIAYLSVAADLPHSSARRSVHRACQEVAAVQGVQANSFAAAVKKLDNLYRRWLEDGRPAFSGDLKVDKGLQALLDRARARAGDEQPAVLEN
jgi:hypothetical protein